VALNAESLPFYKRIMTMNWMIPRKKRS
jgi:hypothetical protein